MRKVKDILHAAVERVKYKTPPMREELHPHPIHKDIMALRGNITIGHEAESFLAQDFMAHFTAFVDAELESAHSRLLKKDISGEVYTELYQFIAKVAAFPEAAVAKGRQAAETLKRWEGDGTLAEAELLPRNAEEN